MPGHASVIDNAADLSRERAARAYHQASSECSPFDHGRWQMELLADLKSPPRTWNE
jgi:hypothetical protein